MGGHGGGAKREIERNIKGRAARGRDRTISRGKGRGLAGRGRVVIRGSSSALITGPCVNRRRTGEAGGRGPTRLTRGKEGRKAPLKIKCIATAFGKISPSTLYWMAQKWPIYLIYFFNFFVNIWVSGHCQT